MIKVFIAGATGWVGTELSKRIMQEKDETLILRHDAGNGTEPYIKEILMCK